MDPEVVFKMREEYQQYKLVNFNTNFHKLFEGIEQDYDRMVEDSEAYGHNVACLEVIRANDAPKILWRKSPACELLQHDITNGRHLQRTPKELQQTRPEYMAFDLKKFRSHIYQELDSRAKPEFRFALKKIRPQPIVRPGRLPVDTMFYLSKEHKYD
jgi:hypothetical protein